MQESLTTNLHLVAITIFLDLEFLASICCAVIESSGLTKTNCSELDKLFLILSNYILIGNSCCQSQVTFSSFFIHSKRKKREEKVEYLCGELQTYTHNTTSSLIPRVNVHVEKLFSLDC